MPTRPSEDILSSMSGVAQDLRIAISRASGVSCSNAPMPATEILPARDVLGAKLEAKFTTAYDALECLAAELRAERAHDDKLRFGFRAIVCDKSNTLDADPARNGTLSVNYASNPQRLEYAEAWTLKRALATVFERHARRLPCSVLDPTDLLLQARNTLGVLEFGKRCVAAGYSADDVCRILDERREAYSIRCPIPIAQDQLPDALRPDRDIR